MVTILSKKQFVLNIVYAALAVILLIFSCTLNVAAYEYIGEQTLYKIYDLSALIISSVLLALGAATVFSFIGKKIPFLISNLIYFCVNTICIVSIFKHGETLVGLYIFIAALVLMLLVVILQMSLKFDTSFMKVAYTSKEVVFNVFFSISVMVTYLFMKAFCVVEVTIIPNYYAAWNFFGTFDRSYVSVSYFEAAFLIVLTVSAILFWYKKYKAAFAFTMIYALMFLISFFKNIDCPHRTSAFPVVAIISCVPIVLAVIKFKGCIKVNAQRKKEELDLMLKEGIITQESYNEKLNALNLNNK